MSTPYAKALVRIAGGAQQSGGITVSESQSVALEGENTSGWRVALWQIIGPPGWSAPAGWTDVDGVATYSGTTENPPSWTLPTTAEWGKWAVTLTVNGGEKDGDAAHPEMVDTTLILSMLSSSGLVDLAVGESSQFDAVRGWSASLQSALRVLEDAVSGGFAASRMAVDANTYALWKCTKPGSGNDIPNDAGAAGGSAMDLALNSTALQTTHWDWVIDAKRAPFGSALALMANAGNGVANAPRWKTSASVVPAGNQFTYSAVFTFCSIRTPFTFAPFLCKSLNLGVWSGGFYRAAFGLFPNVAGTSAPCVEFATGLATGLSNGAVQTGRAGGQLAAGLHTLVCTVEYGAAERRVYIDGYLAWSELSTATAAKDLGAGEWFIGANFSNHCEYPNVYLHEVRLDTTLRDAAWCQEHFERAFGLRAP